MEKYVCGRLKEAPVVHIGDHEADQILLYLIPDKRSSFDTDSLLVRITSGKPRTFNVRDESNTSLLYISSTILYK